MALVKNVISTFLFCVDYAAYCEDDIQMQIISVGTERRARVGFGDYEVGM